MPGVKDMDPLSIGLICFLGGAVVTGGTIWGITASKGDKDQNTSNIIKEIGKIGGKIEAANAEATKKLTNTDLLAIPCSEKYLKDNGESLCREMFCRMNRQGDGKGSSGSECDQIANTINSDLQIKTCMNYWGEDTAGNRGLNQNSRYAQCLQVFEKRK